MKVIHSQDELPHGYSRPVATIGNFDGLHLGHRQLLLGVVERAGTIQGTATAVTFHPHPLHVLAPNNAPRLIQTLRQRLATIEDLIGAWGHASRALEIHIALRLWSLSTP